MTQYIIIKVEKIEELDEIKIPLCYICGYNGCTFIPEKNKYLLFCSDQCKSVALYQRSNAPGCQKCGKRICEKKRDTNGYYKYCSMCKNF